MAKAAPNKKKSEPSNKKVEIKKVEVTKSV